jgi:NADH:ubiquinone oxidoreductase subunit F (NADH-binding)
MISSGSLPRVLHGSDGRPLSLAQHEEVFIAETPFNVMHELENSGLTGRGGAAFPTFRKVDLLRLQRGHNKSVVVNVMEGEPAAHKEFALAGANPHLILEGAQVLAGLIGAKRILVCVARDNPTVVNHLSRAIHELERRSLRGAKIELHTPPWRYVAGEESALVHWLNDNESLPQYRPERPSILRVGHSPVLVDNAETCANVALIARFGAEWFRKLGTAQSPGSTLVSLTGAVERSTVLEVSLGTPIRDILAAGHADMAPQALLLGGFGGTWLHGQHINTPYANEHLAAHGASVGAGVMAVLPREACGVYETLRIVRWMANESARQCGPCAFGLPALAEDLTSITHSSKDPRAAYERLQSRCDSIEGRGACRHPDGVIRLVRSALIVFADDIAQHIVGRPCTGTQRPKHTISIPSLEHEDELIWE